jgi:2,4-dienoyl-CoA reductase-like NADH-dependent reductase (Old Yellow Enzyme family)
MSAYPKVAQLKSVAQFRQRLADLQLSLPVDDTVLAARDGSPLAEPLQMGPFRLANRWVIHPMEGWDAHPDGSPSELTLRRWRNFGYSGAALIWGGEAAAVQPDGRANPRQTLAVPANRAGLAALLDVLQRARRELPADLPAGLAEPPVVGLQLTHSGRFCKPNSDRLEPRIAYHHPLLDARCGIDPHDDSVVWTDDDLERLIDNYLIAAHLAAEVGFPLVDIKACHGYLLHEFLSARTRPGRFGGDLEGRTRVLRSIIERIRQELPQLAVAVRLSVFDTLPYRATNEVGQPMSWHGGDYPYAFGADPTDPGRIDLSEPVELLRRLQQWGVVAVNLSCGSPYYNPHVQRPAIFPPSDGYQPPEDPLAGVVRQIEAARQCRAAVPRLVTVGTGYSYLQDYLPQVAQAVVRAGWIDAVGLGRVVLSYPQLPHDVLVRGRLERKRVCRTFSDCTTAPRNGLVSGCYPLDAYYKSLPEAETLRQLKGQ